MTDKRLCKIVVEQSLSTDSSSSSSSSSTPPSSFNNSAVPLIIITAPSRENLLETPVGLKIADANKEPRPMGGPVFVGRGRFVTGTA
ncbi:hypothetical protein cypCar_00019633 [Cyprinus carpio]|nr:hypothetical protein cypCar_00019633 [Cyprinus carpio]